MSVTLSALFVVLAITPGLALIVGATSAMRLSRDLGNATFTLAFGAAAAVASHLAASIPLGVAGAIANAPFLSTAADGGWPARTADALERLMLAGTGSAPAPALPDMVAGLGYACYATVVGAVMGWALGRAVMRRQIETRMFHGAAYDFVAPRQEDDDNLPFASVLTKTPMGGGYLMYEGLVADYRRHADGTVAFMALLGPYRVVMLATSDKRGVSVGQIDKKDIGDETEDPENVIFIDGADIANIVLYSISFRAGSV